MATPVQLAVAHTIVLKRHAHQFCPADVSSIPRDVPPLRNNVFFTTQLRDCVLQLMQHEDFIPVYLT